MNFPFCLFLTLLSRGIFIKNTTDTHRKQEHDNVRKE